MAVKYYACPVCGEAVYQANIRSHAFDKHKDYRFSIKRYTTEKDKVRLSYVCDLCKASSAGVGATLKHIKRMHPTVSQTKLALSPRQEALIPASYNDFSVPEGTVGLDKLITKYNQEFIRNKQNEEYLAKLCDENTQLKTKLATCEQKCVEYASKIVELQEELAKR